ncbi:hypothetical protein AB1Y20_016416 [Prymnesium parvum]|uniref:Uncharacterized protein n=1 Tax=Prymnesium parvum TaxID=97485 RepID=A0AB34ID94_PRYPA
MGGLRLRYERFSRFDGPYGKGRPPSGCLQSAVVGLCDMFACPLLLIRCFGVGDSLSNAISCLRAYSASYQHSAGTIAFVPHARV